MKAAILKSAALTGTLLVLVYTALISSADGIAKLIANGYSAPQLYVVSGILVVLLSIGADRVKRERQGMRTSCPRAMAVRALAPYADFFSFGDEIWSTEDPLATLKTLRAAMADG